MDLALIKASILKEINDVDDLASLEKARIKYLGRKGELTNVLRSLSDLPIEERKKAGAEANALRVEIEKLFDEKSRALSNVSGQLSAVAFDFTRPGIKSQVGSLHPLTVFQWKIEDFFRSLGFSVFYGPEVESDYYNFEALNIPPNHPARDMQDTFYIDTLTTNNQQSTANDKLLMRTHTTELQVRLMEKYGAPLRVIMPGRCFRNEATDARHEHTFYQLDGVMVGEKISFANLKAVLIGFAKFMFGEETKMRLRPKLYPFVEPGVNVEVTCFLCKGKGCRVCKKTGWMEIAGAGMIHPNVLKAGKIDSKKYSGFAFGSGLSRLVMLKYGIDDARILMSGDLRFIRQF